MPTYMFVANRVLESERFYATYVKEVQPLLNRYGSKFRMLSSESQVLEGDASCEGATIMVSQWPDKATALRFWNSPEYQRVKKLRAGIAEVRVWLVDSQWYGDDDQPLF